MPKIKESDEVRELMSGLIDLIYRNMPTIQEGRFDIEIKPDGSPVTQSDVYVENLVKQYIEEKFRR